MAVLALQSVQKVDGYRKRPTEDHGKLRIQYFEVTAVAVAGDIGTTIDLCRLPAGAVRVIPHLSRLSVSAFGASRTLSIGHLAYAKKDDGTQEAANPTAFVNALDVSSAVTANVLGTGLAYDLYSKAGVDIQASVAGGTIPVNATLEGFIVYVYE